MVEERDMPVEQAQQISQDASDDRRTVVRVGAVVDPPTIHHVRRHDIDPDDGNVIFVEHIDSVENDAYLCIPEEDDEPDTAGCGRVGRIIRDMVGHYPEETLPATVEIEGDLFHEIIQETVVGPDTDRQIEFESS